MVFKHVLPRILITKSPPWSAFTQFFWLINQQAGLGDLKRMSLGVHYVDSSFDVARIMIEVCNLCNHPQSSFSTWGQNASVGIGVAQFKHG